MQQERMQTLEQQVYDLTLRCTAQPPATYSRSIDHEPVTFRTDRWIYTGGAMEELSVPSTVKESVLSPQNHDGEVNMLVTYDIVRCEKKDHDIFEAVIASEGCSSDEWFGAMCLLINASDVSVSDNVFDIIDTVTLTCRDARVQLLTGMDLRIIAVTDSRSRAHVSSPACIVVPLPFFFSHDPSLYISARYGLKLRVSFKTPIKSLRVQVRTVHVNDIKAEHLHSLINESRRQIWETQSITKNVEVGGGERSLVYHDAMGIGLPPRYGDASSVSIRLFFISIVKDLRILVLDRDSGKACTDEPVHSITLYADSHVYLKLDGVVARHYIPCHDYECPDALTTEPVYHVPLCLDPGMKRSWHSGHINFSRINQTHLQLVMRPGTYTVHVLARSLNAIETSQNCFCFIGA